jgi:hypothetical protein
VSNPQPTNGATNDFDWKAECQYISNQTDKAMRGHTSAAFNRDPSCLRRYVQMQQTMADKQFKYDVSAYLQHCIDDLSFYA